MKDVAPELLEKLNKTFSQKVAINPQIRSYKKKLEAGKLTEREIAHCIFERLYPLQVHRSQTL